MGTLVADRRAKGIPPAQIALEALLSVVNAGASDNMTFLIDPDR